MFARRQSAPAFIGSHSKGRLAKVGKFDSLVTPTSTSNQYVSNMRIRGRLRVKVGNALALRSQVSEVVEFAGFTKPPRHGYDRPGFVRGHHFTEYVEDVKTLRRSGREEEAERLLLEIVDATEVEARSEGWGVAPWYYEQLAIIYRKAHDYDREVAIMERYRDQPKAPGARPKALEARLAKARDLRSRAQATETMK